MNSTQTSSSSPSSLLEVWINPQIIEDINTFKESFSNAKPYEHISISNFLKEEKAKELEEALFSLNYEEFNTDLYHFFKSKDFKSIEELNPTLQEFYTLVFSKEMIELFQTLTSTSINFNKQGDLHSILLQQTHYLLCHDDQVDERSIAFIFNLSRDFTQQDGGALELFDHNDSQEPTICSKVIVPSFNQLNVFKVSPVSFHQISEVESAHKNRLSISGWYYK